jgi:hypothetical protein
MLVRLSLNPNLVGARKPGNQNQYRKTASSVVRNCRVFVGVGMSTAKPESGD